MGGAGNDVLRMDRAKQTQCNFSNTKNYMQTFQIYNCLVAMHKF